MVDVIFRRRAKQAARSNDGALATMMEALIGNARAIGAPVRMEKVWLNHHGATRLCDLTVRPDGGLRIDPV